MFPILKSLMCQHNCIWTFNWCRFISCSVFWSYYRSAFFFFWTGGWTQQNIKCTLFQPCIWELDWMLSSDETIRHVNRSLQLRQKTPNDTLEVQSPAQFSWQQHKIIKTLHKQLNSSLSFDISMFAFLLRTLKMIWNDEYGFIKKRFQ